MLFLTIVKVHGYSLKIFLQYFLFLLFSFAYHNCYFQVKLKSWREDIYEFYFNKNFHLIQPLLWPKGPKHSYIYLISFLLPLPPPYFLFFIFFPPFFFLFLFPLLIFSFIFFFPPFPPFSSSPYRVSWVLFFFSF